MAIDVVPTKVSDMTIKQLVQWCAVRDPQRWRDQGDRVVVGFGDDFWWSLPWDDFGTIAEVPFRNHLYAGVCSSLEQIARDSEAELNLNHLLLLEDGKRLESFSIRNVRDETPRFWMEFGENRAEAALRAFVSFLRATT